MRHKIALTVLLLPLLLLSLLSPVFGQRAENTPPLRAPSVSSISIPTYSGGTASTWMVYDGGQAMTWQDEPYESKMQIISNTNATEYLAYCKGLLAKGYTRLYSRVADAKSDKNRYLRYLSPEEDYVIYAYYTPHSNQTRLIVDTHPDTLRRFSYSGTGDGETEVYMYSLSHPDDCYAAGENPNTSQRRNGAGSMFVLKMPDNSLFIVDGGGLEHMGDRDAERLYRFCRQITGVPETERMIISSWFISHGHADHYEGFPRFISLYNDSFLVKNIMYNFEVLNSSRSYIRIVSRLYPEAKFYKPHTGDTFSIAGVQFEVLYTTEDRYKPNSSNKLLLNDSSCTDYPNENNSSTVLSVSFDGKKLMLTGDLQKAEAILLDMHPASALKSDILQIPHHGADYHVNLVKTVAPTVSFINQVETARARLNVYANHASWKAYCGQLFWAGTETVGYKASAGIFYREAFTPTDYLGWSSKTYSVEKEHPYTSAPVAASEEYYRYSKVGALTTDDRAYVIADHKLDRVLAYDAGTGKVGSNYTGLFHKGSYYFAASQRKSVNWLIRYTNFQTHASAAVDGVKTYYGGTPIQKGSGDYWGTANYPTGMVLGKNDTFTATGMYDTWASGSQQFESLATGTWIDALKDGSFLIYRHYKGTYYPLYRDASVATDDGWGVTELSKTDTNAKLDYLKTCLYAYEATPSQMNLFWTGHKDYTVTVGISQADLISLIAGDLQVSYSLVSFGTEGLIPYDAYGIQKPGTYWLDISPAYDPQRIGDYSLSIRYKNANGAVQNLGSVSVHVKEEEKAEQLFFSFDNLPSDQERYQEESVYGGFNFDGARRWKASFYDAATNTTVAHPLEVNTTDGTMKLSSTNWSNSGNALLVETYAGGNTPLKYDPQHAQVLQIRLKMSNMKAVSSADPFLRLWYYKSDGSSFVKTYDKAHYMGSSFVSDGQYTTITMDLYSQEEIDANASVAGFPTSTFSKAGNIGGICLGFHNFTAKEADIPADMLIDYIYIGPKSNMPEGLFTVDFRNEDGSLLESMQVSRGSAAYFTGSLPVKAYDTQNHYSFVGWKTLSGETADLERITDDLTVYASFAGSPHSYTTHITPPTCTAQGHTTYTCSRCSHTYEDNYTSAKGHTDTSPADNRCDLCTARIKEAALCFRTLSLKGNIAINYYMDLSDEVAADENAYMLFTMENGDQIKVPATQGERTLYQGAYYYSFSCAVTAKEMTDTVLCRFFWSGGQTESYTYSVKTYADRILTSSTSSKLRDLICAMLNYGAASQIHFQYHTERLANAGQAVPDYTQVTVEGFPVNPKQGTTLASYTGASLLLTSETTLRIFFHVDSSVTDRFTVTYKGQTLPLGIRSDRYFADIPDIGAKDLDEYFTLTIHDGTESAEVSYSPLSYCASVIENAKGLHDRELQDVAAAMYLYNQAANAYFPQ